MKPSRFCKIIVNLPFNLLNFGGYFAYHIKRGAFRCYIVICNRACNVFSYSDEFE